MSTTIDLRKKIHEFVDHADDRILKIFYAIITSEEIDQKKVLEQKILQARNEKKKGKLITVDPSNVWKNIK